MTSKVVLKGFDNKGIEDHNLEGRAIIAVIIKDESLDVITYGTCSLDERVRSLAALAVKIRMQLQATGMPVELMDRLLVVAANMAEEEMTPERQEADA